MTEDERRAAHLARRGQKSTDKRPKWLRRLPPFSPKMQMHLDYIKSIEYKHQDNEVIIMFPGQCPCGCGLCGIK